MTIRTRGVWVLLLLANSSVATSNNTLNKVFHHRRGVDNVEVGSVALYFAQKPKLHALSPVSVALDEEERVFLFKTTNMTNQEIKKMVHDFNTMTHALYDVKIEHTPKEHAVKCIVRYNPKKVDMQYDSFEAVGMDKGLVFRFFNKEMIHRIREKSKSILSTACVQKAPGVVIDCGHGGVDCGARCEGLFEKDLTMHVGLQVAALLKKKGFQVFFTRDSDTFVPLDERTFVANALQADLFVSIHANFASNAQVAGLETYCLKEQLFTPLFSTLDAQSNAIVTDYTRTKFNKGSDLAKIVHSNVIKVADKKNPRIADRKIAHAVTQVLLGAQMPAVLVELGFLSNNQEATLLKDKQYQNTLAQGICDGIVAFSKINA